MKENTFNKTLRYLKYVIIALSILYVVSYIIMGVLRMSYPFELEWMEGGSVDHVARVLLGKEIYVRPSIEFIPYIYTPLYTWVSAAVAKITGIGFFPLRLVSFISSLAFMLLVYLYVKHETRSKFTAFWAMGLVPACFVIGGSWYDLARVDSLFLALLMLAAFILRTKKTPLWFIVAGFVAFLSFFTKQSGLLVFGFLGIGLLIENWKRSLYFIFTFAFLAISSTIIYNTITNGWYWYWNFGLVARHRWTDKVFLLFWTIDMLKPMSVAIMFSILYFFIKFKNEKFLAYSYNLSFFTGMILYSYMSRLHYGGYDNVLQPAYFVLIIFMSLGLTEFLKLFEESGFKNNTAIKVIVLLMTVAQLTSLNYNPRKQLPQAKDLMAGNEYISHISKINGEVYNPYNCFISTYAGKNSFAHSMLIFDLINEDKTMGKMIDKELENALASGRFKEIYLSSKWLEFYPKFDKYYEKKEKLFTDSSAFFPVTGFVIRPEYVYVPKKK